MNDVSVNAGVTAQQGFALQRNMALFILLDNYEEKFDNTQYFLSIEHMEDIVFCFLDKQGKAKCIETYQSKKKSNSSWKINASLVEIIIKILRTGKSLVEDSYPKCSDYKHELYFSTNASIVLEKKVPKIVEGKRVSITHSNRINEQDLVLRFDQLNVDIQSAIKNLLGKNSSYLDEGLSHELKNLNFLYVDFAKTNREQEYQLRGKLEEVFSKRINDYSAALSSIFELFKKVELTYNQKSQARLSDKSKYVMSNDINNAINVITTKAKAFDYWRGQTSCIAVKLRIKPYEKDAFERYFISAFDLFKSKEQAEHRKILTFVKNHYLHCQSITEEDCVKELIQKFKESEETNLDDDMLRATVYAAYFESICKVEY